MTCSLSSQVKWALPSPLDNAASHDNSSLDCKALLDMTNKRTMFNITDQPPSLQWPSSLSLRYILHQMLWKSNKFYPEVRRGALVSFVCSATNATAEHDGGESSHSFHHFAFQMEVAWRAGTLLSPPRVKCVCSPQWYVTKLSSPLLISPYPGQDDHASWPSQERKCVRNSCSIFELSMFVCIQVIAENVHDCAEGVELGNSATGGQLSRE